MVDSTAQPEKFTHETPAPVLEDLRHRLNQTRWPDAPAEAGWALGADLGYLRQLVSYWASDFDWPAQESKLAQLPRFQLSVGGHTLHFIHARAAHHGDLVLPLLLCHGWPDSFWRYTKVVSLLTDPEAHGGSPEDAFDVVIPDMPGYGYSSRPTGAPLSAIDVAALYAELMTVLGYKTYGAAGGDKGSSVSRYLGLDHSEHLVAVHRMDAGLPVFAGDLSSLTTEERAWIADSQAWAAAEGAYGAMHRTKPQTAAFSLNDSPVGLAAWIVEKLRAWSDCGGDLEKVYTKDEILTNVMIYWLTGTIGSSMRMYQADAAIPAVQHARRVEVPTGFSIFQGDISHPPRAWLERTTNLSYFAEPPRGGHFAPFEQPELYAAELRHFFRPFRSPGTR